MKRTYWIELGPSLLVGAGILLSSLTAVHTRTDGWWSLAAPLVMALTILGGMLLTPGLREKTSRKVWLVVPLVCCIFLAAFLLTRGGGRQAAVFLPSMGAALWVAVMSGLRRRRNCNEAV